MTDPYAVLVAVQERVLMPRIGLSCFREMDKDIVALRAAAEVIAHLLDARGPSDLDSAATIVARIDSLVRVQAELKRAFKDDELDGGWRAALTHPLYLRCESAIADLRQELTLLS